MIITLIAVSTIAVSGALAVKTLIAGVLDHLEADDIPLSARPKFGAHPLPQRRALALRTAAPPTRSGVAVVRHRQAAA